MTLSENRGFLFDFKLRDLDEIRRRRGLELNITVPLELRLDMGSGFLGHRSSGYNYQHFLDHLPSAQGVYMITYNIPKRPLTDFGIIRRVYEINNERGWGNSTTPLSIVTGFGIFGDFPEWNGADVENYPFGSIEHASRYAKYKLESKRLNAQFDKELSEEQKAMINIFKYKEPLVGVYFYPNLHSKIYFTDKLVYIGSANPNAGSIRNAEAGITLSSKEVIQKVKLFYLALLDYAISLDNISKPPSYTYPSGRFISI